MRTMLSSVLILILWGAVPALAQLPPEIQADLYLLRAEQAIGEGDSARARAEIDKIILLEKDHELDLPEEYHFRYAKAAAAADLPEQAQEAVVKYLTLAGREGKHYQQALELINKAQDVIELRKEPQAASPEQSPSAQPARQSPVDAVPEAARATKAQLVSDCGQWNTKAYFRAATVGRVTACLAAGADAMARDRYERTPLHLAAESSENPVVIETLLKAGADPMARNKWQSTPLHLAARFNENVAVIEALLRAGTDLAARNKWQSTALHYSARYNANPAVIKTLLNSGADLTALNEDDRSPLYLAREHNANPAVRQALLTAIDPTEGRPTPESETAPESARETVDWIPQPDDKPEPPSNRARSQPTARVGEKPRPERSQVFNLKACKKWNTAKFFEVKGITTFDTYGTKGRSKIVACLESGADLMARDEEGRTPLHFAAGRLEAAETLLEYGADPMARDNEGRTPLHRAGSKVVDALLAADADLEARDNEGRTPLHLAVMYGQLRTAEVLLAAGSDRMAMDSAGRTPLHLAAGQFFYSQGFFYGNSQGDLFKQFTKALLAAGADLEARDNEGRTPLHIAATSIGGDKHINDLVAVGADLEARDNEGRTPLHMAALDSGWPDELKALLAAGADPKARDDKGRTPLDLVNGFKRKHRAKKAELLGSYSRNQKRGGGGGLGALIAGVAVGTALGAAGASEEEALAAGTIFAEQVRTGQPSPGGDGTTDAAGDGMSIGGSCEIPGYPRPPGGVANLGLAWCPASVSMQVRAFALQAAGAQCAIATGSSSTPEQIQARRREISAACGRLAALGAPNCQCSPRLGGSGSSQDTSAIDREQQRREQQAQRQEEARRASLAEKRRIEAANAAVLNSDCSCIRIEDDGEYACLDGFVVGNNSSGKPLCDIKR